MRLLLAFAVPVCILRHEWMLALVLFGVAALSDALDGWCARRWPYTPEEEARLPWRRIDPHALDNGPDTLLLTLSVLALAVVIPYWWLYVFVIFGVSLAFFGVVQFFVRRGQPRAAEVTDVVFGYWFALSLGAVIVEIAHRAGVLMPTLAIGLGAVSLLLPLKWERVVSRPETRAAAMKYVK